MFINYGTLISAHSRVRIGQNVMVGNYSIIADTEIPGIGEPPGAPVDGAARGGDWRRSVAGDPRHRAARDADWGRAVIAAGSVVSGEIPAGAVAGGIPARILRAPAAVRRADMPRGGFRASLRMSMRDLFGVARSALWLRACDHVGDEPRLHGRPTVMASGGRILIGDRFRLASRPVPSHLVAGPGGVLEIGDDVSIAHGAAVAAFETRADRRWNVHRSVRGDHGHELPWRGRRPVRSARLPAGHHRQTIAASAAA